VWTNRLTPEQTADVLALAERAATADGTMPLNEEAHFALRGDSAAAHFLLLPLADLSESEPVLTGADSDKSAVVVGYLHWQPGYRTAQLVVDPDHRRRGIGRRLVGELDSALRDASSFLGRSSGSGERIADSPESERIADSPESERAADSPESERAADSPTNSGGWGIWAFGDLPAAQGFAAALGLHVARGLLVMERTLAGVTAPDVPSGLTLRGFEPADAAEFLAVNAAAFAHHPEQGALDSEGFAARRAEPWFDPAGLILGFDDEGLAGFHWTKRVGDTGEVYVIGVAPRAQGRGYGKVLLQAGLAHLAERGAHHVLLYVDMAEPVAVRMYESAGFHVAHRDVLYAPDQEQP
jgi:mycothiol synthase